MPHFTRDRGGDGENEHACLHFNVGRTAENVGFRFLHSMMLRSGSVGNLSWLAKWPPRRGRCGSDRKGPMHLGKCSEGRSWNQMDGFIQKKFVSTIHPARV